jgi:hypothetical protein
VTFNGNSVGFGDSVAPICQNFEHTNFSGGGGATDLSISGSTVGLLGDELFSALSISAGGRLDIARHTALLNYAGASPLAQVTALLQSGRNGGSWDGPGLMTSLGDPTNFTLGVFDDTTAQQIKIMYTRYGDADLSGKVDSTDLLALANNWGQSGRSFQRGDFNFDGTVDGADLGLLAANWQLDIGTPASALPATLPFSPAGSPSRRAPSRVLI